MSSMYCLNVGCTPTSEARCFRRFATRRATHTNFLAVGMIEIGCWACWLGRVWRTNIIAKCFGRLSRNTSTKQWKLVRSYLSSSGWDFISPCFLMMVGLAEFFTCFLIPAWHVLERVLCFGDGFSRSTATSSRSSSLLNGVPPLSSFSIVASLAFSHFSLCALVWD